MDRNSVQIRRGKDRGAVCWYIIDDGECRYSASSLPEARAIRAQYLGDKYGR